MYRLLLFVGLMVAFAHCYESQQIQMPEAGALFDADEGLSSQVQALQKNITELWTYIHTLRTAVTQHLNHLRQHQVELETVVRRLEHPDGQGDTHAAHTDDHHHGDDQHSHSGEHHSHSGEHHSHSGEHHSHSDEHHSHGDDHQHSHSGEHHSHSGGDHSHSGGDHSHSGGDHSHSGGDHSHSSGDHHHSSHSHSHTSESSHAGHEEGDHHHRDSHESEDDLQQSQQVADPLSEPLVVPVQRQSHSHPHPLVSSSSSSTFKPIQLMNEDGHHHHNHHHHHHGSQTGSRNRSRAAVVMPKYSEYSLYDFAVCSVQPNRAIPEDQQQSVVGQVTLWQKKLGGPLNIHVKLQGFGVGDHHGAHQAVQQEEDNEAPLEVGHRHGFHIHTNGDLSDGCQSTGPHYNPKSTNHGGPNAIVRHVGDLGNIECDEHGVTNIVFSDGVASLKGQYSIIGKSMVIHSGADDYGLGGNEESLRTGNAGVRIACCVIEKVDKLPIRSYKAIKSASQYQN